MQILFWNWDTKKILPWKNISIVFVACHWLYTDRGREDLEVLGVNNDHVIPARINSFYGSNKSSNQSPRWQYCEPTGSQTTPFPCPYHNIDRSFILLYFQVYSCSRSGDVCADHGSMSPPNIVRSPTVPRHREEGPRGCHVSVRSQEAKCDNRRRGRKGGPSSSVHRDAESIPEVPVSGQWLPHRPEEPGAGADHRP